MNRNLRLVCSFALLTTASHAASEEVTVTASKHGTTNAEDAPVAINVFGGTQLRALNVDNLTDLSYALPNVQLEDVGTARGIANFSIRGVGVNSSTSSIDPAVGVFVDGLYLGMNAGTLSNLMDVEAVEVLRGPQGTLYGRNVTGGAILLRSREPGESFEARSRLAVESGPNVIAEGAVSGPLVNGLLLGRLAVLQTHDAGWFTNQHDGSRFGENSSTAARLSLRLTPTPALTAILRAELGEEDGDGPAGQNHALFTRSSFDFSINNPGYARTDWKHVILQADWQIPFGTLTSISGWRKVGVRWAADIDSTPVFVFHTRVANFQSQRSEELRYAATFGSLETVAGLYYLDQDLTYLDERNFSPTFRRTGGGQGYFRDWAAFGSADWHISDTLTFSTGLRYTHEIKHSQISRVRRAEDNLDGATVVPGEGVAGGNLDTKTLNFSDRPIQQSWDDLSPRIGLQWRPSDGTNLYASWSRAFRSGGANFRTSSLSIPPQTYDPEKQSSFELGWKQSFARGSLNIALFHNRIEDMQRDTNLADPVSGVQQLVLNAGDAVVYGGEIEGHWEVTERLALSAELGLLHGGYSRVTGDLNGDLVVNDLDRHMRIPRLAPLTVGGDLSYTLPLPGGALQSRFGVHHRDATYYNDTNLGRLAEADMLDASFTFTPTEGGWSASLYGRNLSNVATWGGDTTLPSSASFGYTGGALPTFSPLNKGRVLGVELRASY